MMIKYSWIILGLIILLGSCKPPEEIVASGAHAVRFSADTILFDTVFSTVGTVTLRLKVYNDNSNAIRIGKIYVGGGTSSPFQIIINGLATNSASDVLLLGNDSLYVLVKLLINPQDQNLPYIVNDSIVFTTGSLSQNVRLVAWGQDATFLNNKVISSDSTLNSQKPYVIYGNLTIESGASLTIKAGVRLFFGANAALIVKGKLTVIGTSAEPVSFNTSDLTKQKGDYPGQWSGIQILNSSSRNSLSWSTLSNASTGVSIIKTNLSSIIPDITISHSIIKNMTGSAISGQSAYINIDNSLLSNCAFNIVNLTSGANGSWINNTFVCYGYDFFRGQSVLYLSDKLNGVFGNSLNLKLYNNIVWGSMNNEVFLDTVSTSNTISAAQNVLKTSNCHFWTSSTNFVFDFSSFSSTLTNDTIHFIDTYAYNFRPDSLSPVRHHGLNLPGYTNTDDLDGKARNVPPDIGAYDFRKN